MSVVRLAEGGRLSFFCPGCGEAHTIRVGERAPGVWGWNRDLDRPTFEPSVLLRTGHYCTSHKPGDSCWCTYNAEHPEAPAPFACAICHSFVREGRIQFLNDSTHALAGQTVPLPEWQEMSFAVREPTTEEESGICLTCGQPATECDCTGGPLIEPECSCYEPEYGHQPGCAFYGRKTP